ncbi:MAG: rhamnulose-1-phosphate aldolase [Clostridia bacterium]|nr:rhamnulose-1-phosphate aldolase [Clostridia bacterium]
MKKVTDAPFLQDFVEATQNIYRLGWAERNGGNISYLIGEDEAKEYLDLDNTLRTIPTGFDARGVEGKIFLVTGAGKYFRNVIKDPAANLGIIRVGADGASADVLWGFKNGGRPTSEFSAHILSHRARLSVDPENKIVMHCHPNYTMAMTYSHELDEAKFTRTLWSLNTECIVDFPDGVGVLPWMPCGTPEIGAATAEKLKEFRIVVWAIHGIYAVGRNMDEAFGLIETVEKTATTYLIGSHLPIVNRIPDDGLAELCSIYDKKNYRKDFLPELSEKYK